MLFRAKAYIKFLLNSTNQHGVHSPFVYSLVTLCFYKRTKKESSVLIKEIFKKNNSGLRFKDAKLLNRLIPYFQYHKTLILGKSSGFVSQIAQVNNSISVYTSFLTEENFDFIYLDFQTDTYTSEIFEKLFLKIHNNSLLLIHGICTSEKSIQLWNTLKEHPRVRVTINTYYFGFVFFRKEQAKEHFTIRM